MPTQTYLDHVLVTLQIEPILKLGGDWEHSFRTLFLPSFYPEVCITIQIQSGSSYISLSTAQTNLWRYGQYLHHEAKGIWPKEIPPPSAPEFWKETKEINLTLAPRFFHELMLLEPLTITNLDEKNVLNLDGIEFRSECLGRKGQHNTFSAINPPIDSEQYIFAHNLYASAKKILEDEKSTRVLEHIIY